MEKDNDAWTMRKIVWQWVCDNQKACTITQSLAIPKSVHQKTFSSLSRNSGRPTRRSKNQNGGPLATLTSITGVLQPTWSAWKIPLWLGVAMLSNKWFGTRQGTRLGMNGTKIKDPPCLEYDPNPYHNFGLSFTASGRVNSWPNAVSMESAFTKKERFLRRTLTVSHQWYVWIGMDERMLNNNGSLSMRLLPFNHRIALGQLSNYQCGPGCRWTMVRDGMCLLWIVNDFVVLTIHFNVPCRPLEVIGHDGKATNVTMLPGDLVLYESHSVLHGVSCCRVLLQFSRIQQGNTSKIMLLLQRPFPLKGRFMANVFVHFEPIGPVGKEVNISADLPNYVIPGTVVKCAAK